MVGADLWSPEIVGEFFILINQSNATRELKAKPWFLFSDSYFLKILDKYVYW